MKFQIKVAFISILCCVLIMEVTAGRSSSSSSKSSSSKSSSSSSSSSSKPCEPKPLKKRVKWLENKVKNLQDRQDAAEKERGFLSDIVKQCKADLASLQSNVYAKCDELQEKLVEVNGKVDGIMDDLNPCNDSPCLNGGTCENPYEKHQCQCSEHWTGDDCSVPAICDNNPCKNDGTCSPSGDGLSYKCDCPSGFEGQNCEDEKDPCNPTCKNNQPCKLRNLNEYYCDCGDNYFGKDCSIDNPCSTNPCQNFGLCRNKDEGPYYYCECRNYYSGYNCEPQCQCERHMTGDTKTGSTCAYGCLAILVDLPL